MLKENTFEVTKENGMIIRGRVIIDDSTALPAKPIIISHGFTANMTSVYEDAKVIAQLGYMSFIFDFCGGGFETISDGDFHTYMTVNTELSDLDDMVNYVLKRDDIIKEELVLMGCSQGGFMSAIHASRNPAQVKSLILFYPALCIPDDARKGSMQVIRFDPDNIPDSVGEGKMRVSGDYPRIAVKMDMDQEMKDYHGPVLLLHGDADAIVPVRYSEHAKEVYGEPCEFHILNGAPHGFHEEPYFSEAMSYVRSFLTK